MGRHQQRALPERGRCHHRSRRAGRDGDFSAVGHRLQLCLRGAALCLRRCDRAAQPRLERRPQKQHVLARRAGEAGRSVCRCLSGQYRRRQPAAGENGAGECDELLASEQCGDRGRGAECAGEWLDAAWPAGGHRQRAHPHPAGKTERSDQQLDSPGIFGTPFVLLQPARWQGVCDPSGTGDGDLGLERAGHDLSGRHQADLQVQDRELRGGIGAECAAAADVLDREVIQWPAGEHSGGTDRGGQCGLQQFHAQPRGG